MLSVNMFGILFHYLMLIMGNFIRYSNSCLVCVGCIVVSIAAFHNSCLQEVYFCDRLNSEESTHSQWDGINFMPTQLLYTDTCPIVCNAYVLVTLFFDTKHNLKKKKISDLKVCYLQVPVQKSILQNSRLLDIHPSAYMTVLT